MTNKIFNRFEVARKDIFQTVIDEMLRVGWVQKNKGDSSENNFLLCIQMVMIIRKIYS
ncbi:hypothetical protein AAHB56_25565 [Bacillus thuringiensis]